jgi:hypothetical protein
MGNVNEDDDSHLICTHIIEEFTVWWEENTEEKI